MVAVAGIFAVSKLLLPAMKSKLGKLSQVCVSSRKMSLGLQQLVRQKSWVSSSDESSPS